MFPSFNNDKVQKDEHGVIYSLDGKRLLDGSNCNCKIYRIREGTEYVCNYAFIKPWGMKKNLEKIIFPSTLIYIPTSAIPDNCSIHSISPNYSVINDLLIDTRKKCVIKCLNKHIQKAEIYEPIEEIGENAFRSFGDNSHGFGQRLMEYLILPQSLKKLGKGAFEDAGIRAIYIAGPQTISERCFQGSGLRKVILGDNVKTIENVAFGSCSRLEKVVFGRNIKVIGDWAFDYCLSLKKVVFPDSLEKIGKSAFGGCGCLTNIEIPDSVTEIGENAFSKCKDLKKVKIGKGLTAIPECCFSNCSKLNEIIIPDTVIQIAQNAFKNCSNFTIIGNIGSSAEQFAKENNIKFEAI